MICWDGSEPDPFDGSCPLAPTGGGPQLPPLPGCSINAATFAVTPLPRNRTTLGVGEKVALSSADGSTWTISGDGALDSTSGGTVVFTAGETAGTATVSVSAPGCLSANVAYSIIEPSGLRFVAVNGVKHTQGFADIGMKANVYLLPDSVSFKGLAYLELDAQFSATGPYACQNGASHIPNPNPEVASFDDIIGLGTPIATDTIESGTCYGVNQFGYGSESVSIPQVYMVSIGGAQHQFNIVQHIASALGGALNITKGAASRSSNVSSPTSTY